MKPKLVSLALACLLATASGQVPSGGKSQRPRAEVYALEGLGALGGLAGCAVGGGCAGILVGAAFLGPMFHAQDYYTLVPSGGWDAWGYVMLGVGAIAIPASTGYAASSTGDRLGESGSRTWAIVGAYAGVPVAAGLILLGTNSYEPAAAVPLYTLGALAIPAGAVVGYNLGAKREVLPSGSGSRLQPPGVALTGVELPDHSVDYGVKVQLAGLRF